MRYLCMIVGLVATVWLTACGLNEAVEPTAAPAPTPLPESATAPKPSPAPATGEAAEPAAVPEDTPIPEPPTPAAQEPVLMPPSTGELIQPGQLIYLGAFRLPPDPPDADDRQTWGYSGEGLAYWPDGDPTGPDDGFPGSLFGTGHDVWNDVAEFNIPAPSPARTVEALPSATMLQTFGDVRGGLFDSLVEIPRVGMAYLPAQGAQGSAKLYLAWGQHFHDEAATTIPSHAWCNLDLAKPDTQGAWWVGQESLYSVNGYLFSIPAEVADQHLGGARLATGRYRDGGWSGMGPSLFAIAPWQAGDPPPAGSQLPAHTLLRYAHTRGDDPAQGRLEGYRHADEWDGGAWLVRGDASAVVFVGTKASGYLWYGYPSPAGDGAPCPAVEIQDMVTCYAPDGAPCTSEEIGHCEGYTPESRGWWSTRFDSQMIFYDPAHLIGVALGEVPADAPQPYAVLDLDEHLFLNGAVEQTMLGSGDQRRYRLGETAYDRERNLIYVLERFAEQARPVVHVWRVGDQT